MLGLVEGGAVVSAFWQLTFRVGDGPVDVRNGRVIDHGHDGNVDIQSQHVNVGEIEEGHARHHVPRRNATLRRAKETSTTFIVYPVIHTIQLKFLV